MANLTEYGGRIFVESDFYPCINRQVAGLAKNKVWLYTVEKCDEINRESGEPNGKYIVRIIRWRAKNHETNKQIKFWRAFRSYNIRSPDEWSATSELVDNLIDDNMNDSGFIVLPKEEYDALRGEQKEKENIALDLMQRIRKLKNEKSASVAQLDIFRKRFSLMKANIKSYELILSEFKSLIEQENSTETDVHKFVANKNAFWLFGLDYIEVASKVGFPPEKRVYEFDLMLRRQDAFWDLAELKGPNENLFDKRTTNRNKPNQKLSEALGQVFTYLHACDAKKLRNILKPKAIIVIGKDKTDNIEERRLFSSYITNVEIITYSELYARGKKLIEYIKSSASSKS